MMVDYLKKVAAREDLSEEEAYNCMKIEWDLDCE